jgi:hypothetical protein
MGRPIDAGNYDAWHQIPEPCSVIMGANLCRGEPPAESPSPPPPPPRGAGGPAGKSAARRRRRKRGRRRK